MLVPRRLYAALFGFGLIGLGCRVIPPSTGDGNPTCLDPLVLTGDADYVCGDEVVIVLISDPLADQVFFDTFAFDGSFVDANRFVLINETDHDVTADVTFVIDGEVQGFENEPLAPGEVFFVDTDCTEDFVWGNETDGLCLQ